MTKKERIQEAIEAVGAEAVNLAITLAEVSDPDGAYDRMMEDRAYYEN